MPDEIARIEVDRSLCIGSGLCVATAPKVFQLDDDMVAVVKDPRGASQELILEAATGCPTTAILLFDAAGKQLYPEM